MVLCIWNNFSLWIINIVHTIHFSEKEFIMTGLETVTTFHLQSFTVFAAILEARIREINIILHSDWSFYKIQMVHSTEFLKIKTVKSKP